MSKACASPTARLLQGSRLFSLPKALPANPRVELHPSGLLRSSATATTPYPTHQAIDSPHSSRAIGEWGLKRHLPTRTTTKSASPIRILAQDTNDHVTDFISAGDHSMSLQKFQELSIPVLRPDPHPNSYKPKKGVSVYENAFDITDRAHGGRRWKYNGPWLLGMSATELDVFLAELKARRPEWLEYLREYFAQRDFEIAKQDALTKKGIFGPVEFQNLSLQRDHIMQDAENEVRALQQAGEGTHSLGLEEQCRQIMATAQQKADECEAELEVEAQHLDAIHHLEAEERRVTNIMTFADQKTRHAHEELQDDDAAGQAYIEQYHAGATEQTLDVLRDAYSEVIRRFGGQPEPADTATLETHARRLVSEATASITTARADRARRLKEWEEETRQTYYPNAQRLEVLQKELRDAHKREGTRSELTMALVRFLDLPGLGSTGSRRARLDSAASVSQTPELQQQLLVDAFMDSPEAAEQVLLSTHPAAGLGYLRSSLHIDNHPVYGPQAQRSAVLARVVQPRTSAIKGTIFQAKLGVAGFVANDPRASQLNNPRPTSGSGDLGADQERMAISVDPTLVGGNKMYVHAESANVGEAGQVRIQVARSEKEAIAVKTGQVQAILDHKKAALATPAAPGVQNSFFDLLDPKLPEAKHGIALSNYNSASRRSAV